MILQRSCKICWFVTFGIVSMLTHAIVGMSQVAYADDIDQESAAAIDEFVAGTAASESSEAIEEITVYGEKPLQSLRREVYRAEENFFEVYSKLNEDDEYDVRCFYEIPSFTHIRRHVCRAKFVTEATSAESAPMFFEQVQLGAFSRPARYEIDRKKERLRELMEALAAEHPELLQALIEYTDKKQILDSEKARRYDDK